MKKFHIGDLLSLTTGNSFKEARLLSPEGMEGVRKLFHFLTGDNVFAKNANNFVSPYGIYGAVVREEILKQHPCLTEIDCSDLTQINSKEWVTKQITMFGETLSLHPMCVLN